MEVFQPEAIVVCGGADSLSGDRLGCFNLSLEGHSGCMEFLAKFGVPMLILGGGKVIACQTSQVCGYCSTNVYFQMMTAGMYNMCLGTLQDKSQCI